MRNALKYLALAAALLPGSSLAQAPQFPKNLPGQTVVGRLATSTGPSQAIPFSVLSAQMTSASIRLNSGNGQTAPGLMAGGGTYSFGSTTDTPRMTGLGLGGVAPATGLEVYNAAVTPTGNSQGMLGANTTNGGVFTGQGSLYDASIANKSGLIALGVTTGTQDIVLGGGLTAASLSTSGTVAGSLCATSAGKILYEAAVNCFTVSGISVVSGKTLTVDNTIELAGTDGTKFTFPGATDTVETLAATQTVSGVKTFSGTFNCTGTCQLSGTAFGTFATQNYATPPAIGGTTPNTGAFSTLTATTPIGLSSGGTNAGTAAAARASGGLNVDQLTSHGDSNYQILATDRTVGTSATLTSPRTWTLPAASAVNSGQHLYVQDFKGLVSSTNTITIPRNGSDTINGGTGSQVINTSNGGFLFISDGISNWSAQALGAQAVAGVASINGQTGNPSIVAGTAISVSTSGGNISVVNTGVTALNSQTGSVNFYQTPQIRLTLTQGTPVTTTDVTAATSLYLEPYNGAQITVYDGSSSWVPLPVASSTYSLPATQTQSGTTHTNTTLDGLTDTSQLVVGMQVTGTNIAASSTITVINSSTSVTLNNATTGSATNTMTFKLPANTNYDVYAIANSGVPKIIWSAAWSNDTTPPTRALQNGVEVASGTTTSRLIGSVRTTSVAGQLEDSHTHRFVSNRYNEQPRPMYATDATASWTYSTASYRQANAATGNQLDYIACVARPIWAQAQALAVNNTGTNNVNVGIGIDSASASSAQLVQIANLSGTIYVPTNAIYTGTPGLGRHYVTWLEFGGGSNTQTWLGTSANNIPGIIGEIAN